MVNTGYALIGYSLGIPAFSGTRVIIPGFYSMKDTKTPFYTSFVTLLVNAGFGVLLLHPLKHFGLALANSIASWANFLVLFYLFERKFGVIKKTGLLKEMGVTAASCVPVVALCFAVYRVWLAPYAIHHAVGSSTGASCLGYLCFRCGRLGKRRCRKSIYIRE